MTHFSKQRPYRGLLILGLLLLGLTVGLYHAFQEDSNTAASLGDADEAVSEVTATNAAGSGKDETAIELFDADALDDIHAPHGAMYGVLESGLPAMLPMRRYAYELTAKLSSVEELVDDMGNLAVSSLCASPQFAGAPGISKWSNAIPNSISVARLIQEGQKDPDRVAKLVEKALLECLDQYDQIRKDYREADILWASGKHPPPTFSAKDKYYAQHRRYNNGVLEGERVHVTIYTGFYVLATIGRLPDPAILDQWCSESKIPSYGGGTMNVWLIDQYFRQTASTSGEFATRHRDLMKGQLGQDDRMKVSQWNAPWDIHHPLLAATGVDPSDIPTISVLRIPMKLEIDRDRRAAIVANFKQYAHQKE